MTEARPLRVMVVDDQSIVRIGFQALLAAQPDITVVAVAEDGLQAVRAAVATRPDVVLMDVRMPVMGGIDATRAMQDLPNPPRVLVLTTFDLDEYVYDALRAGASGFLLKDAAPERILEAVRVIGAGEAMLAPNVTARLIADFATRRTLHRPPQLEELSPRELEVFGLVAHGLANAEIARSLHLAEQTVKTHVSAVLLKLGLRDRVQVVVLAYESGLITPGAHDALGP